MAFKQVTNKNFKPGTGDDRFPVYSKQLNDALKALNGDATPEPVAMKTPYTSVTASRTLSVSDSGGLFVLSGGVITMTLPAMTSAFEGFTCTIISGSDDEHVMLSGGASLIYYDGSYGSDHATNTGRDIHQTVSSLTLNAAAINDTIKVFSDGVFWYCSGSTLATVDAS
ncbi:hypothetical protein CMI37_02470 [Candidatus Pacearchaeota archaeon]|nr:hypothetical protein [Candidatus Pacearchaeota archaeon]|tara:strand:+ start:9302 stop:9808 length:507 start_codon:yes stop_codon:yes gene_type:complete